MEPPPAITLAIPTYNRAALLRQTLECVARQDLDPASCEVLVIDNNSLDDTAAVVASFACARHAPRHVLETRQGLDHARNRAIAEARGAIIVFADDDILAEPGWLRELTAPLAADRAGHIGAVGGEVIPVFPDGLPAWLDGAHRPLAFRPDAGPLGPAQVPMGANMAFPARVFAAHGGFTTALDRQGKALFSGGDGEMIRRLRAAGLEIWFAPAGAVRHQMPASRLTFHYATRHAFDSARSRVVDRTGFPPGPGGPPFGYLSSRFAANIAKAAAFALAALFQAVLLQTGPARKSLVRAWRSCGYLYQIPRSLFGKL